MRQHPLWCDDTSVGLARDKDGVYVSLSFKGLMSSFWLPISLAAARRLNERLTEILAEVE